MTPSPVFGEQVVAKVDYLKMLSHKLAMVTSLE
jgi:hypothetical protein